MNRMVKSALILLLIAFAVFQSMFLVQQWQQCVVLQFGKPVREISAPGLYFKAPFIQDAILFEKRILGTEAKPSQYMTLDKKRLIVDTVAMWKVEKPLLFFQTVRDYSGAASRLNDIIFARLRQEIADHSLKDFVGEHRQELMNQVITTTEEQARPFGISVVDVRVKRLDLPEDVQNSVFTRMKTERERMAKRYRDQGSNQARQIKANAEKQKKIALAEAYRQSQLLQGEGDAAAAKIYSDAYGKNIDFFRFVRSMDLYKSVFNTGATFILGLNSPLLRFIESPNGDKSRALTNDRPNAPKK